MLSKLELDCEMTGEAGELLATASFAPTVKWLNLTGTTTDPEADHATEMFTALCRGSRWDALTDLTFHARLEQRGFVWGSGYDELGIGAVGLRALANASFVPQLKHIELVLNETPDPVIATEIVERLDPDRLQFLHFVGCGDVPLPESFVRKFGSRAGAGVYKTNGDNGWDTNFWLIERTPTP